MPRPDQVTDRCTFHGEGPFWDGRSSRLRFVDMLAGDVVTLLPTGTVTRRHVDDIAAVIRARESGGYLVAIEHGFALFDEDWTRTGTVRAFDSPAVRMNEGNCDPQGRFYCGSMSYDLSPGAGALYRLDPDLTVDTVLESVTIPNGLQWSADGARAFHADTGTGRIDVYDFDAASGRLHDPRPFITIDEEHGAPDGTTVDDEGGLWVALWGGGAVRRYDADGTLSEVVELPVTNVTACTFAGAGSPDLYITTSMQDVDPDAEPAAGAVFSVATGARGVAQAMFAG
ncbi:SMP-30/gluconolactonase/LRE family protein [Microbacteriaceae bacterium 4G12]